MQERHFMHASEALAEAAIQAGCRFYAAYPITPSSEVLEYMAKRMPEVGGVCMVPESEIAAVSMVLGAAACGVRSMIASCSTAVALMQETFSHAAYCEVPFVAVNMTRYLLQSDYYQAVKGGGYGDYRMIVLAPHTTQEMVDLTMLAFHLSDKYRNPALILSDHLMAHTTETVEFPKLDESDLPPKDWATTGAQGRPQSYIVPFDYVIPRSGDVVQEEPGDSWWDETGHARDIAGNRRRSTKSKLATIAAHEQRAECRYAEDCDVLVVAFGSAARTAKVAVEAARREGLRAGIVRPITLWPFPGEAIAHAAARATAVLVYELNLGQMVEDVRAAVFGRAPVHWFGGAGTQGVGFGATYTAREVLEAIKKAAR